VGNPSGTFLHPASLQKKNRRPLDRQGDRLFLIDLCSPHVLSQGRAVSFKTLARKAKKSDVNKP